MPRPDQRKQNQLRDVKIKPNTMKFAEGSCTIMMGDTQVLCSASVDEHVPGWMRGKGKGWVTAEYSMLPRSCNQRIPRDIAKGRLNGRSQEIQRLIGRSLRSVTDMTALGERTIWVDCDVLQGDGGTRCAAITGGYVALAIACEKLVKSGLLKNNPLTDHVAAVSVGMSGDEPALDLCYAEDSAAAVDMNVVMTGGGKYVEVQGTAEREPFSEKQMKRMLALASEGIKVLIAAQKKAIR